MPPPQSTFDELAIFPAERGVPARGLAGELARVGRALRERPLTLPRMFVRP